MAFRYEIDTADKDGVHQRSPEWLLAFVPYSNRETKATTTGKASEAVETDAPLVVSGDCIRLDTGDAKNSPSGNLTAVLKNGDKNYLSSVSPGDYVFAWMSSDPDRLASVAEAARRGQPCNSWESGLKFFGKVASVRERMFVDPMSGMKEMVVIVTASSFVEMAARVYFNPVLHEKRPINFIGNLVKDWTDRVGPQGMTNCQDLVTLFLNVFMGKGPEGRAKKIGGEDGLPKTPNNAFIIPRTVASMLGRPDREKTIPKYTDILDVVSGLQKYDGSSTTASANTPFPWKKFQPKGLAVKEKAKARQKSLPISLSGDDVAIPNEWSSVPVWSLLNTFANTVVNELFTSMRADNEGRIVPTLVHRQIPFTTDEYAQRIQAGKSFWFRNKTFVDDPDAKKFTRFLSLPRWIPSPSMVYQYDIGKTDAARINFVQCWGINNNIKRGSASKSDQVARGNYFEDELDIMRSGLRPHIVSSQYDFFFPNQGGSRAPAWSQLIADWVTNGHLKTNGTIVMAGIDEPIAVGDNLEWRGIVYHIEQISHSCSVDRSGNKSFRTTVALSNGIDARSENTFLTVYPGMDQTNMENMTNEDALNEGILPGIVGVETTGEDDRTSGGERKGDRATKDFNREKPKPRKKNDGRDK